MTAVTIEAVPAPKRRIHADEAVNDIKAWLQKCSSETFQGEKVPRGVELVFTTPKLSREHVEELQSFVATELEGLPLECMSRCV
jgi:hypothetical protein